MTPSPIVLAAIVASALVPARAGASPPEGSPLALAVVAGAERPELVAQRVIDRSWGPSEDSTYVVVDVPHWREEGVALSLAGAVPGVGQAYVGAWRAAAVFALLEAAGWFSRSTWRTRGHELEADAARYAGPPTDPASRWSAARWSDATGSDASELLALYAGDPRVFYDRIANDPGLLAGWSEDAASTRAPFRDLRGHADDRLRYARYVTGALCLHHVIAGWDALHRARTHNARIEHGTRLKLGAREGASPPAFALSLERSF